MPRVQGGDVKFLLALVSLNIAFSLLYLFSSDIDPRRERERNFRDYQERKDHEH